jgi:hypothetical protein
MTKQHSPTRGCPNCKRRGRFKEHCGTIDSREEHTTYCWQCLYCGAIVEKLPERTKGGVRERWKTVAVAPIVLAPGEFAELGEGPR